MTGVHSSAFEILAGPPANVQRLWLVRHGATDWNMQKRFCGQLDQPLIDLGRLQVAWTASILKSRPLERIYSSDLSRASETAEIIAAHQQQPVNTQQSAALRELNFGAWEGLTYSEAAAGVAGAPGFFEDPEHYPPPGGELLVEAIQRIHIFLLACLQEPSAGGGRELLFVSHGGILRGLLCFLLGIPLRNQWQLHLANGSLSALDLVLDEGKLFASLSLLNLKPPVEVGGDSPGMAAAPDSLSLTIEAPSHG